MVSRFSYPSFKGFDLTRPVSFVWLVLIAVLISAFASDPPRAFLLCFGVYALSAPAIWVFRRLRRKRRGEQRGAGSGEPPAPPAG